MDPRVWSFHNAGLETWRLDRGRALSQADRVLTMQLGQGQILFSLAVQSLSIPNRWVVPLITAGSCQSRDLFLKIIQQLQPEAQYIAENANWK